MTTNLIYNIPAPLIADVIFVSETDMEMMKSMVMANKWLMKSMSAFCGIYMNVSSICKLVGQLGHVPHKEKTAEYYVFGFSLVL